MKKVIKWIFIVIAVTVFAIDIAGFWKYKLNGTKYELQTVADDGQAEEPPVEEQKIEYADLKNSDMQDGEKLFITNIDKEDDGTYTIKGLIYEQVEITKEQYNTLKNGKSSVEILGKEYKKDKIKSNNIILKEATEQGESNNNSKSASIYVKYDSTTKKYLVMYYSNDKIVYNKTQKYIKYNASSNLKILIGKDSKKIADIESKYKDIEIPEDTENIKLAKFTFNKQGKCTSITIDNK